MKKRQTVKLLDLNAQYDSIKSEIDTAIHEVIAQSQYILGPANAQLEQNVAEFCHTRYAVGLNSGTDALIYALRALNIGPGDEVITTPFTFIASAEAIVLVGARPVFADIDPRSYNIDPTKIEKHITDKTKAIIPVHLYGNPADMDSIMDIAKRHNLYVIEDAAQAIGATYHDKVIGSIGTMGCISFFPAKNLGAFGDAGMVTTDDASMEKKIRMWANHGSEKKYYHEFIGDSSRLDNMQAAILLVKLKYIDQWNKKRIERASRYTELLSTASQITTPWVAPETQCVFQQYTIRIPDRDTVQKKLDERGIPTAIHYPLPLHLQPAFQKMNLGYSQGDFPESERAAQEVLSLPIYPELTDEDQDMITREILSLVQ